MLVTVNGTPRTVEEGLPLVTLLEQLCLKPAATVVERNGIVLERPKYAETVLAEGDVLELVRFVGGG
jgi:thiamine biosynthesis protein ThiS